MKTKFRNTLTVLLAFCLLVGGLAFHAPQKAAADELSGIYQVNGKYSISNTTLITKCALYTADEDFPKKTRVYKMTSKTKVYLSYGNGNKKTLTGKKRQQMIKKLNKKNETIQFEEKNGKVLYISVLRF